MKIRVQIIETRQVVRTYEVDGVNSLETAAKCAKRCATQKFQPNTYMMREVPCTPQYEIGAFEIIEC